MHLKFKDLLEMAERLRGENGCPWDKKQTIASMRKCVVDESEELSQAILNEDTENIEEEIGDLLFTLILIAQIAREEGKFDMGTVMQKNAEKLIERQTWVFGTDKAKTAEEALELWNRNKQNKRKKQ